MQKILMSVMAMTMFYSFSQNVGIGTRSPAEKLHVAGGLRIDSLARKRDSGLVFHDRLGSVFSVPLTGRKSDILRGDGSFAAAAAPADAWLLGGNAGTTSSNFLGTTDSSSLLFRVNNDPASFIGLNNTLSIGRFATRVGKGNIALGQNAMRNNENGDYNIAIGADALSDNKTSENNIAIGTSTLRLADVSSRNNIAIGTRSLTFTGRGSENTALGHRTLSGSRDGDGASYNVAVGNEAMEVIDGGIENVAIGYRAFYGNYIRQFVAAGSGSKNVAVGFQSLYTNLQGNENTALGYQASFAQTGDLGPNTAVGFQSLYSNSFGFHNTAVGHQSMYSMIQGEINTASGYQAMYSTTGGDRNTATGGFSLYRNTDGSFNAADGFLSMYSNTTGGNNASIGYFSLYNNSTGSANTAAGSLALNGNQTGSNNTAAGYRSLEKNKTGSANTALGMFADVTAGNLFNATAIGYSAKVSASNKVRIGNASVIKIEGQVPYTTPSDGRYKYNVKEDVSGLDFIMRLRPVTYQFNVRQLDNVIGDMSMPAAMQIAYNEAESIRRTGFIAQEVEKAAREVNYNFSGVTTPANSTDHYSLSYESFVVPLVKGMQEQQAIIAKQNQYMRILEAKLNAQQKEIDQLKQRQW